MLSGCQQPSSYARSPQLEHGTGVTKLLLMPVDVELAEITTGGVREVNDQWTLQAKEHLSGLLDEILRHRGILRADYRPRPDAEREHVGTQVLKLHAAVGNTILQHYYNAEEKLPTKARFDWTLGPAVAALRAEYECDYALFVLVRDSYASSGRAVLIVLAVLATSGYFVPKGGQQSAFASLVDLRSGDVVWFNRIKREMGDLRTREAARETVAELLTDFPK